MTRLQCKDCNFVSTTRHVGSNDPVCVRCASPNIFVTHIPSAKMHDRMQALRMNSPRQMDFDPMQADDRVDEQRIR